MVDLIKATKMAFVQDVLVFAQSLVVSTAVFHVLGQGSACFSTEQCFECGQHSDSVKQRNNMFYSDTNKENSYGQEPKMCICRMNLELQPVSRTVFLALYLVHGFSFAVVVAMKRKFVKRPPATPNIILFCLGMTFLSTAFLINQLAFNPGKFFMRDTTISRSSASSVLLAPLKVLLSSLFTFTSKGLVAIFYPVLTSKRIFNFQETHNSLTPALQKLLCPTISTEIQANSSYLELIVLSLSYFISFVYSVYLTFSMLSEKLNIEEAPQITNECIEEKPLTLPCNLCEQLNSNNNVADKIDGRCSQDSDNESFVLGWRL